MSGPDHELKSAELAGPAGEFTGAITLPFAITRGDFENSPSLYLLIYVFHDGGGTLKVAKVTVDPVPSGSFQEGSPNRILDVTLPAPPRSSVAGAKVVVLNDSPPSEALFPVCGPDTLLLPGETRVFCSQTGSDCRLEPVRSQYLALENRDVAVAWQFGTAKRIPFWARETTTSASTNLVRAVTDKTNLPALPELPAWRHAFLFYWGHARYGKKQADVDLDRKELGLIRRLGFTGLCVQDDYGLDFAAWKKNSPLSADFLTTFTRVYREAGFRSPLVYGIYSGLDKGRNSWAPSEDQAMRDFLTRIRPPIEQAASELGATGLWLWPVDEPNDPERCASAATLLAAWKREFQKPLMVTGNWRTAQRLAGLANRWIGPGSCPSFEAAYAAGINGFYGSLDACDPPLKYRWLSGVFAWASGIEAQAYWHFQAISGSEESDLDAKQEDFISLRPGTIDNGPALSLPLLQVAEGLQDLRLLCAVENLPTTSPCHSDARRFLDDLRKSIPRPNDRLSQPWLKPAQFERIRTQAIGLLIRDAARYP